MLTNNELNTKAIVAKYTTAVNDLAKKARVHEVDYPISSLEMESYSPHQQLIAALWYAHEGFPSEHPFCLLICLPSESLFSLMQNSLSSWLTIAR